MRDIDTPEAAAVEIKQALGRNYASSALVRASRDGRGPVLWKGKRKGTARYRAEDVRRWCLDQLGQEFRLLVLSTAAPPWKSLATPEESALIEQRENALIEQGTLRTLGPR